MSEFSQHVPDEELYQKGMKGCPKVNAKSKISSKRTKGIDHYVNPPIFKPRPFSILGIAVEALSPTVTAIATETIPQPKSTI
jgi:hypothetical protein